jgi:hypothetical protein
MILIIFGTGVDCQVVLSGSTAVADSAKGVCIRYCRLFYLQLTLCPSHIFPFPSDGPSVQHWVSGYQEAFRYACFS